MIKHSSLLQRERGNAVALLVFASVMAAACGRLTRTLLGVVTGEVFSVLHAMEIDECSVTWGSRSDDLARKTDRVVMKAAGMKIAHMTATGLGRGVTFAEKRSGMTGRTGRCGQASAKEEKRLRSRMTRLIALAAYMQRMSNVWSVAMCGEFSIRRRVNRTWFHPDGARYLSNMYAKKATKRFRKGGRFLTLTYDRKPYADPQDLFERQREEQHVNRFMQRLSNHLGRSLKGEWMCKLEFQQGGWVHFHILLDHRGFIDQTELMRLWGHGYVYIERITARRIKYTCKYASKTMDDLPAWLLAERANSVRIIRVSPGLWKPLEEESQTTIETACEGDGGSEVEDDEESAPVASAISEFIDAADYEPPRGLRIRSAYRPIGEVIASQRERVQVEIWERGDWDESEWFPRTRCIDVAIGTMLIACNQLGGSARSAEHGWFVITGVDPDDLIERACELEENAAAASGAAAAAALYLTDTSELTTQRQRTAPWLIEYYLDRGIMEYRRAA